ncbi:MAG: cell division protein ZapA, partial [Myxococcales bacterium]|nr:cell division protein ZapA [Myxococcales bacterium]
MASGRTVELRVAGQSCRVVTTADDAELGRLTAMVEQKLGAVVAPGRPLTTQAMLLVAIALAHDAEAERTRAETIRARARECIDGLLGRIDAVLGGADDGATRRGGDRELAARGAALTALAGGASAPAAAARAL